MITKKLRKSNDRFGKDTILIHGQYGVGKTLLAAEFEKPYFIMFENNEAYRDKLHYDNISNWAELKENILEFMRGDHEFKTLVLDGIDLLYECAKQQYINEYNTIHTDRHVDVLTDIPYAKGYDAVDAMIRELLNPVDMDSRYSLVLVAHTEEKEITSFSGETFTKLCPQLPKRARIYFCRLAQNIFYFYYYKEDRYLNICGNDFIDAKNRGNGHFLTTSGEQVKNVPMPKNPKNAYRYLLAAYYNKLSNTYANIGIS